MMPYSDPHAHLDGIARRLGRNALDALFEAYAAAQRPLAGTGQRSAQRSAPGATQAFAAGLEPFIVDIGVDPGDLDGRIERYGTYPFVRFTAGLWPGKEAFRDVDASLGLLERDLSRPECVALGECGLDYHHMDAPPEAQIELFKAQIALAERFGLTLVVHSREAVADTFAALGDAAHRIPVLIHCFGYGPDEAKAFLDSGCHISFAGNLSYGNSTALRDALVTVPRDRLLLETDSPYMNPMPLRGKPSTPLDLRRTYDFAAGLRGEDVATLALALYDNADRLFSVSKARGNPSILP
ncbi:MAG: TatD family hydrolase [Rectinemataceae bacterium]